MSIFPSLFGLRDFPLEENTLKKWVEALNIIRSKLPNFSFVIKPHPNNKSERLKIALEYLQKNCEFLDVYVGGSNAEELVLGSNIIVGDVSTILWWANFRGNKIVISLGMQDFAGSKDMSSILIFCILRL